MAVQNTAARTFIGGLPPTTVMTGNLMQIIVDVVDVLHGHGKSSAKRARLSHLVSLMLAFSAGAITGAVGYSNHWLSRPARSDPGGADAGPFRQTSFRKVVGHVDAPADPSRLPRARAGAASSGARRSAARRAGALDDEAFAGLARAEAPAATSSSSRGCTRRSSSRRCWACAAARRAGDDRRRHGDEQGSVEAALRAAGAVVAAVDAVWAAKSTLPSPRSGHRPSRDADRSRRLLPVQQRRDRRAPCPGQATASRGSRSSISTSITARHPGGGRNRPVAVLRLDASVSVLSGTGHARDRGIDGNVVNVPLRPVAAAHQFRQAWADHHPAALDRFAPQLVIVFGRLRRPQGRLLSSILETEDFAWITRELLAIADRHAQGRLCSRAGRATASMRWPTQPRPMCVS